MLTQTEIIQAMQYERFNTSTPINTTGSARKQITFQYAGGGEPGDLPSTTKYEGWRRMNDAEKAKFEEALDHIETYLNVEFVKVQRTSDPDLNVAAVSMPGSAIGHGGYSINYQGDTITSWDGYTVFDADLDLSSASRFELLLHEIGHAMGLRHTFEASTPLPAEYENNLYSIMSYSANPMNGVHSDGLMLFDVLALQDIWGAASINEGASEYTGCRTTTVDSIWDSGGIDALNATGRSHGVTLDLREGAFSSFDADHDVVITFGTKIENALGASGADRLYGNNLANELCGYGGRDLLVGKAGHDHLEGRWGRDTLRGDWGNDTLLGGNGRDLLKGGQGNDLLKGNNGNDRLNGKSGDDLLVGGLGADVFVFDTKGGHDTVDDFKIGKDRLKMSDYGARTDLLDQARDTHTGVLFHFGEDDSLLLRDVTLNQLGEDFLI